MNSAGRFVFIVPSRINSEIMTFFIRQSSTGFLKGRTLSWTNFSTKMSDRFQGREIGAFIYLRLKFILNIFSGLEANDTLHTKPYPSQIQRQELSTIPKQDFKLEPKNKLCSSSLCLFMMALMH